MRIANEQLIDPERSTGPIFEQRQERAARDGSGDRESDRPAPAPQRPQVADPKRHRTQRTRDRAVGAHRGQARAQRFEFPVVRRPTQQDRACQYHHHQGARPRRPAGPGIHQRTQHGPLEELIVRLAHVEFPMDAALANQPHSAQTFGRNKHPCLPRRPDPRLRTKPRPVIHRNRAGPSRGDCPQGYLPVIGF